MKYVSLKTQQRNKLAEAGGDDVELSLRLYLQWDGGQVENGRLELDAGLLHEGVQLYCPDFMLLLVSSLQLF